MEGDLAVQDALNETCLGTITKEEQACTRQLDSVLVVKPAIAQDPFGVWHEASRMRGVGSKLSLRAIQQRLERCC